MNTNEKYNRRYKEKFYNQLSNSIDQKQKEQCKFLHIQFVNNFNQKHKSRLLSLNSPQRLIQQHHYQKKQIRQPCLDLCIEASSNANRYFNKNLAKDHNNQNFGSLEPNSSKKTNSVLKFISDYDKIKQDQIQRKEKINTTSNENEGTRAITPDFQNMYLKCKTKQSLEKGNQRYDVKIPQYNNQDIVNHSQKTILSQISSLLNTIPVKYFNQAAEKREDLASTKLYTIPQEKENNKLLSYASTKAQQSKGYKNQKQNIYYKNNKSQLCRLNTKRSINRQQNNNIGNQQDIDMLNHCSYTESILDQKSKSNLNSIIQEKQMFHNNGNLDIRRKSFGDDYHNQHPKQQLSITQDYSISYLDTTEQDQLQFETFTDGDLFEKISSQAPDSFKEHSKYRLPKIQSVIKDQIRSGCFANGPRLSQYPDKHYNIKLKKIITKFDDFVNACDNYLLENKGI